MPAFYGYVKMGENSLHTENYLILACPLKSLALCIFVFLVVPEEKHGSRKCIHQKGYKPASVTHCNRT